MTRELGDGRLGFYAKIRTDQFALGHEPDWSKDRAERFLKATLLPAATLKQDWWELIPKPAVESERREVSVIQACEDYVGWREARSTNRNTRSAATSPVTKHLLPFFAYIDPGWTIERALREVDEELVRAFIHQKRAEREILTDLAEKLAEASDEELQSLSLLAASETVDLEPDEIVLLRRYGMQGGRYKLSDPAAHGRISLSSRGLKDSEINRCLGALSTIVQRGNRKHGLQIPDPTFDLRLRGVDTSRNWLHPHHLNALAKAARSLDERDDRYNHNGREAAIWVLGLCGPRVSELCGFDWRDLSNDGLQINRSKTEAGKRTVQVPTIARTALETHRRRLGNPPADTPIWPTATGRRRDRNSVRNRLLAPVIEVASLALTKAGVTPPFPDRVTPHTFRRTTVTYWYWLGRDQPATMHEIGHKSSRLTLEVYAQSRPRDPAQKKMLNTWMKGVEI